MQDIEKLSFEEAMDELEGIVRQLEGGKVKLEDAVAAYSRGALLHKACEKKLEEARLKIEKISLSSDGNPAGIEPFVAE